MLASCSVHSVNSKHSASSDLKSSNELTRSDVGTGGEAGAQSEAVLSCSKGRCAAAWANATCLPTARRYDEALLPTPTKPRHDWLAPR